MTCMDIMTCFRLDGRIALVTGGSRGLGLEIAQALAQAGARVAILARRTAYFEQARELLPEAMCLTADVGDEPAVQAAIAQIQEHWGPVDILVHAAAITWSAPVLEMPAERIEAVLHTNVAGALYASRAVAPGMMAAGYGKIVHIASVAGLVGQRAAMLDTVAYTASKGAVLALTRDLAVKWGPAGVRVNALAPGLFPTRMSQTLVERSEQVWVANTPLGRIGRPGEIGPAALFLASPASDYITGQVLAVDGGLTAC
jgi:gluconate 5-dehydrogenase